MRLIFTLLIVALSAACSSSVDEGSEAVIVSMPSTLSEDGYTHSVSFLGNREDPVFSKSDLIEFILTTTNNSVREVRLDYPSSALFEVVIYRKSGGVFESWGYLDMMYPRTFSGGEIISDTISIRHEDYMGYHDGNVTGHFLLCAGSPFASSSIYCEYSVTE